MSAVPDFPMPPELALPAGGEPYTLDEIDLYYDVMAVGPTDGRDEDPGPVELGAEIHAWRIEADDQAEWAGRHLAVAAEELARLREQANEWAARIGFWFEQASKRPLQRVGFFEDRLADYAMRVREAGGPSTLTLPSVTVGTTLHKPAVKVEDDDRAAEYLIAARHMADDMNPWGQAWATVDFDPDDLMCSTMKVYVGPLRKLVHVEEIEEPLWDWEVILECGHVRKSDAPVDQPDDFIIPDRGDVVRCPECTEGSAAAVTVAAVVTRQRKRLAAVGPDGVEVPGCTVSEASVTATVKVR